MGVPAGRLIHRIDLQENQGTTQDAEGEPVEQWVTVEARVPALVLPTGGREGLEANALHATAAVTAEVRFHPSRARRAAQRFLWDGRLYDIQLVADPTGRREAQVLSAVARDV